MTKLLTPFPVVFGIDPFQALTGGSVAIAHTAPVWELA